MAGDDDPPLQHRKRLENPEAKCPKAKEKDLRPYILKAWNAGWWCEVTAKNYIGCWPPDGRKPVFVPSTPHTRGNRRDNLRTAFRLSGLDV